jgi:hypothetical protein
MERKESIVVLWLPPKSRPKIDQNKVDHYPSVAL